jgi:Flp pilus assembly protein TadD
MKALRLGVLVVSLLVIGVPELLRYNSERTLYRAVGLAQLLASGGAVPSRGLAVERADSLARTAARGLPGDPRPLMARGAAHLAAGHAPEARAAFVEALRYGERANALVGLGLSEALADRAGPAREAFLRAAWISPSLIPRIPESDRTFVRNEVLRLERRLRAGQPVPIPRSPIAR